MSVTEVKVAMFLSCSCCCSSSHLKGTGMQVALLGKGAFGSAAKRLLCYCCYDSRSIYCLVNTWHFMERVLTEIIVGGSSWRNVSSLVMCVQNTDIFGNNNGVDTVHTPI